MDLSDNPEEMLHLMNLPKLPATEDIKEIHIRATKISRPEEAAICVQDVCKMLWNCSGEAKLFKPLLKTLTVLEKKANEKVLEQLRCYVPSDSGEN